MQNVIDPTPTPAIYTAQPTRAFTVTVEGIAYAVIVLFALLLRLAELDSVPLASSELAPALAAWRAAAVESSGAPLIATSPLNFLLQSGLFSLFGASEFTARLPVALAGVLVILMPLAFRDQIGAGRALALSVILACSPVLLAASKFSEPMVYAALLTGLGLWALTRFYSRSDAARMNFGVLAIMCLIGLILLTEAGGAILALILLLAGAITWLWERVDHEPFALDSGYDSTPNAQLRAFPWVLGIGLGLFAALLVATGFMLHPAGLSAVTAVIGGALRGWVEAAPHSTAAYPLAVALFYEPFVLFLAIAGVVARWRSRIPTLDRFLIAWALVGMISGVIYAGGTAAHALWITLPLSALASRTLIEVLRPEDVKIFLPPPTWARWVVASASAGVLAILALALQSLARSMMLSLDGALLSVPLQPDSMVILLVALMFLFIGYFLFASLWGNLTAAQGLILGVAAFGLITSLGAGWNAAVFRAASPTVLYHLRATDSDAHLLRASLRELALRNTSGFNTLELVVIAPQTDAAAWIVRDYPNARFVSSVAEARGAPIVIAPAEMVDPDFGGAYLGQTFTLARSWAEPNVRAVDVLAWWTQNRLPNRDNIAQEDVVLWLRQDIWDGFTPTAVG